VLTDVAGVPDREVRAREKAALLVRAAVDDVADLVGAGPYRVEQRVPLRGRAVGRHAPAARVRLLQESAQLLEHVLDARREGAVAVDRVETGSALFLQDPLNRACL